MASPEFPYDQDLNALVRAARQGSPRARKKLLAMCRGQLKKLAQRGLPSSLRAKMDDSDLVQDTLLEAFRDFNSFRGQTLAEFALWLTHILKHNLLDAARHFHQVAARDPSREVSLEREHLERKLVDDSSDPTANLDRQEREKQVMTLLSGISPEGQKVLWWRLVEEFSYEEIARELNSTEAAVRQTCSRALQACRKAFVAMFPPD